MSVESKEVTLNLLLFAITFPIFLEIEFDFIFYVPCRSEEISPRAEVADRPPPHPLTVSLTVKCFFLTPSLSEFDSNLEYCGALENQRKLFLMNSVSWDTLYNMFSCL